MLGPVYVSLMSNLSTYPECIVLFLIGRGGILPVDRVLRLENDEWEFGVETVDPVWDGEHGYQ